MVRKQDGGIFCRKEEIQTNERGGRRSHVGGGNLAKLNGSKSQTKSESEKRLLTRSLGFQNNKICDLLYGVQDLAYLTFVGEFRRGKASFKHLSC